MSQNTPNAALRINRYPIVEGFSQLGSEAVEITGLTEASLSQMDAMALRLKRLTVEGTILGQDINSYTPRKLDAAASAEELAAYRSGLVELGAGWLTRHGYNPATLGISQEEYAATPPILHETKNATILWPGAGLLGVTSGLGNPKPWYDAHKDHDFGPAQLASRLLARVVKNAIDQENVSLAPPKEAQLTRDQTRLWRAVAHAEYELIMHDRTGFSKLGSTTLLAALVGTEALTLFNAGDSLAFLVNHNTMKVDQLVSEQAVTLPSARATNKFPGNNPGGKRPFTTRFLDRQRTDTDELISLSWDDYLEPGHIATLALVSRGVTGVKAGESLSPGRLAGIIHKYRGNLSVAANVLATEAARAVDDRTIILAALKRRPRAEA